MITKTQRKYLQSLAHGYKAVVQIGKNGLSDSTFSSIEENLKANELVKIKILNNCGLEAKSTGQEIADYFRADLVSAMGNIFVIYKKNQDKPKIDLPK